MQGHKTYKQKKIKKEMQGRLWYRNSINTIYINELKDIF